MSTPQQKPATNNPAQPSGKITTYKEKVDSVRDVLTKMGGQMASALPKHITVDRMLRVALTAIQKTPKLLDCDRTSLLAAVMQSAELGLEPGSAIAMAYFVPFKGKVTFIPSYRGLIELARRSGQVLSIWSHVVYEKDVFHVRFGLDPDIKHEPLWNGDRGKPIGAYACAKLKGDAIQFEVMSFDQIEKIRKDAPSAAGESSPWATHWEEMAKKTLLRRLSKLLPMSIEYRRALEVDDAADRGEISLPEFAEGLVVEGQDVTGEGGSPLDALAHAHGADEQEKAS